MTSLTLLAACTFEGAVVEGPATSAATGTGEPASSGALGSSVSTNSGGTSQGNGGEAASSGGAGPGGPGGGDPSSTTGGGGDGGASTVAASSSSGEVSGSSSDATTATVSSSASASASSSSGGIPDCGVAANVASFADVLKDWARFGTGQPVLEGSGLQLSLVGGADLFFVVESTASQPVGLPVGCSLVVQLTSYSPTSAQVGIQLTDGETPESWIGTFLKDGELLYGWNTQPSNSGGQGVAPRYIGVSRTDDGLCSISFSQVGDIPTELGCNSSLGQLAAVGRVKLSVIETSGVEASADFLPAPS